MHPSTVAAGVFFPDMKRREKIITRYDNSRHPGLRSRSPSARLPLTVSGLNGVADGAKGSLDPAVPGPLESPVPLALNDRGGAVFPAGSKFHECSSRRR